MTACCEGATTCTECGRAWCRAEEVSPREVERICPECSDLIDGLAGWGAAS